MEPEGSLPYSQASATCPYPGPTLPCVFCAMLPLETLPHGEPSGGVVYLRIVLSPEQASRLWLFLNISVLQGRVVSSSPNPPAGGPPLVGCPRLLIQFIRCYPPYRRPFLYPQPEDAPCRGDRDPLHGMTLVFMNVCTSNQSNMLCGFFVHSSFTLWRSRMYSNHLRVRLLPSFYFL